MTKVRRKRRRDFSMMPFKSDKSVIEPMDYAMWSAGVDSGSLIECPQCEDVTVGCAFCNYNGWVGDYDHFPYSDWKKKVVKGDDDELMDDNSDCMDDFLSDSVPCVGEADVDESHCPMYEEKAL